MLNAERCQLLRVRGLGQPAFAVALCDMRLRVSPPSLAMVFF